jgi:hypothetical protein
LQSAQTDQGKLIRKYYIKIELLVVLINQILIKYIIYKKDIEIKQHKHLLLEKDEENKWLHIATKKAVRFKKRIHKNGGIYIGAHPTEAKQFIIKISKSDDFDRREDQHSTSTSELNRFKMEKTYRTYEDMAIPLESYLHSLFDPLMVKINPRRREHFMVHLKFVDTIVSNLLNVQHKYIDVINQYLELLESNKFNYNAIEQKYLDAFLENINDIINNENKDKYEDEDENEDINEDEDEDENEDINEDEDENEDVNEDEDENEDVNEDEDKENINANILPPNINIPEQNQNTQKCKRCKIFKSLDKYEYTRRNNKCLTCIECKNQDRFKCINCSTWKLGTQFTVLENCKRRTRCINCLPDTIKLIKCEKCHISKLPNLYETSPEGNRHRRCTECRLTYTGKTKFCCGCKKEIIYSKFPSLEAGGRSRRCNDCNIAWCNKTLAAINTG